MRHRRYHAASLVSAIRCSRVTNEPVSDLEPYLGASGHVLIVNQDLSDGDSRASGGRDDERARGDVRSVFPTPGRYKLWAQFQRKGAVVTAAFVIDVLQS